MFKYVTQNVELNAPIFSGFLREELSQAENMFVTKKSPFSIITHSSSHPSTPSHPSSPSSTCITTPFPAIMSHLLISALSAYK